MTLALNGLPMLKSDLTPDPIRDAPRGYGEEQAPGQWAQLPGRATVDTRFARYPTAMVVLARCCSHAKSYTATFWVNQATIARYMGISQQAVSQHFRRLVDWGYLEKLKKEDSRRKFGKRGAVWRVIYDPMMTWKDVEAWAARQPKSAEEEQEAIEETLKQAAKGAKGQQSKQKKQPVDKSPTYKPQLVDDEAKKDTSYKVQLVQSHKAQLVHNDYIELSSKEVKQEDCRRLVASYAHAVNGRWGRGFRHDLRQEELARQLLAGGYTIDSFKEDSEQLLDWMVRNNKQPPHSLQYFIGRKARKQTPRSVEDVVSQTLSSMKMP